MFSVSLTNFGIHFAERFSTFAAAVAFAKTKGFEATIHDNVNGGVAGTWSPINGACPWDFRVLDRTDDEEAFADDCAAREQAEYDCE